MQEAVTTGSTSVDTAKAVVRRSSAAISCLFDRFNSANGDKDPTAVGEELISITTNTKKRLKAYLAYSETLNGSSWATPEGGNCEK